MSGEYFDKFPEIRYNNVLVRDISRRVNFLRQTMENPYTFLPYTIEEGDRAEDIAYHYYGDANYAWLVYLSNNIIDPYHDWPMDEETFNNYIIDKYQSQSGGRKGWDVIDWARDETRDDNVVYYYKEVSAGDSNLPDQVFINIEEPVGEVTEDLDGEAVFIDGIKYTLVKD